uniref:Uncharacterized protein n=1 Tax=Trypanosoma congolense (strain IL3000) TaxID=1068625 RepID=G0UUF8_TRYCI|nr:hypothetical protein, unlikely [Trypanosoma congolense IL3000]
MKAVGKGGCSRKEARVAEGSGQIERRGEERKREDRSQCRSVLRCPHTGSVHFKHVVHRCPLSSPHHAVIHSSCGCPSVWACAWLTTSVPRARWPSDPKGDMCCEDPSLV